MELLFNKDYISIWYDPRRIVVARWRGYYTPENMKKGTQMILNVIKEKKCIYGLNDARLAKGTFLQTIKWLEDYIFPEFVKAGLKKIAYVTSPDPASQNSLDRALEVNDQYEAQVFEDYDIAQKWLLGELEDRRPFELEPENRWVLKLVDKHIILDFADILYVYSHEKGIAIQSTSETHYSKTSMKQALASLPESFIQIHRSYIVNMHHVESIKYHNSGSYHLFLKDLPKIKIPLSKKYIAEVKDRLGF